MSAVTTNALVITTFHRDVFKAIATSQKAQVTLATVLAKLIVAKYGDKMPTFEQHRNDHDALKAICAERGLKDNQYYRKTWNTAIKAVFEELPVSQDAASVAKRALRAKNGGADKAGAKKGETTPRKPAASETIEQLIARIGVFKVLETCAKLLESEESTKGVAKEIRAIKAA